MDNVAERWIKMQAWTAASLAIVVNITAMLFAVNPVMRGLAAIFLMFNFVILATLFDKSDSLLGAKYLASLMIYLIPQSIYTRESFLYPDMFYTLNAVCFAAFLAVFFGGMMYAYKKS